MHVEIYPAFFTPRDEEPILSSSEEKSSEFDWLERKLIRKQKYIGKIEQVLCILLPSKTIQRIRLYDRYMIDILCKKNYKAIYKGLFTLFPNLITKEYYNWWVTRRVWEF